MGLATVRLATWAAKSSTDADDTAASSGAVFSDGKGDTSNPSMTPLPPDTGAATLLAGPAPTPAPVDAEKSAILPIMYSDTTRGSKEDSGSRMTPSSAECAKELSAELVPGFPTAVTVPMFAAEATAASE